MTLFAIEQGDVMQRNRKAGARLMMLALYAFYIAGCAHDPATIRPAAACDLRNIPNRELLVHVPFEVVDGRIYVQAFVDDQGPFRFAVDTGASGFGRADASLVKQLNLAPAGAATTSDGVQSAQAGTVKFRSLRLGGITKHDVEVVAKDYSSKASKDAAFAGILGRDFFADGLLVIDYPRKTLSFSNKQTLPQAERGVLGYERPFRVPVNIGTQALQAHLDTGANVSLVFPGALYKQVKATPLQQAGEGTLTNTRIETQRARLLEPLHLGNATIDDAEMRVADKFPELVIGSHILSRFALLIDQRTKRVAVCQGP